MNIFFSWKEKPMDKLFLLCLFIVVVIVIIVSIIVNTMGHGEKYTETTVPYSVDFSSVPIEGPPLSLTTFKDLFHQSLSTDYLARLSIVNTTQNVLCVTIQSCMIQSASGLSTFIKMNKGDALVLTQREMFLQYAVCFDQNFYWGMGGKLPGIGIVEPPSGCTPQSESKGASIRLMWRGFNSPTEKYTSDTTSCNTTSNCLLGYLYAYTYSKYGKNECGDYYNFSQDIPFGLSLQRDVWYTVTFYVDCGTPGNDDGQFQIFISKSQGRGELVCACQDIPMIPSNESTDNLNWVFFFSTFRGGSTYGWSSEQDSRLYFQYFQMTPHKNELKFQDFDVQSDVRQCIYNPTLG
jgi:hypothetical protein